MKVTKKLKKLIEDYVNASVGYSHRWTHTKENQIFFEVEYRKSREALYSYLEYLDSKTKPNWMKH